MSAITNPIPLESSPPAAAIPPGAYYWSRDAAGYLYPTTTTDTVRVNGATSSVTNPSYGFYGTAAALLTGMYYAAANTIGFTSNGTQVGTFSTSAITFPGVAGSGANGSTFSATTGNGAAGFTGGQMSLTTGTGSSGGTISAITGNGSGNGAAGGNVMISTGAGQPHPTSTAGRGGNFDVAIGTSGSQTTAFAAGAGGTISLTSGLGGSQTGGAAGNGGAGGAISITARNGGSTNGASNGGAGGSVNTSAGNGGANTAAAATGNGGTGGSFNYTPGAGGATTGTGTVSAGNAGQFTVSPVSGGAATTGSGGAGGTGSAISLFGGTGGVGGSSLFGGTPGVGGAVYLSAGVGSSQSNATAGGAGGAGTLQSGTGGTNTGAGSGRNGGAGGLLTLAGGAGGATNSTNASGLTGGAGGTVAITSGAGGASTGGGVASIGGAAGAVTITGSAGGATSGTSSGGAGGIINLNPGAGGTSVGGTAGAQGRVKIGGAGLFAYANAQSIVPAATHTLILTATAGANQSVVASTFIKIATDAANRQIVLPPETSSNGLMLVFANTSATDTMLLRDSTNAATVATVVASSQVSVICDGTTWYAFGSAGTGVGGYWSRSGTTLLPTTHGDIVTSPVQGVGNSNECFGTGSSIAAGGSSNTICGASSTISSTTNYNTIFGAGNTIPSGGGTSQNTVLGTQCVLATANSTRNVLIGNGSQTIGASAYADIVVIGGSGGSSQSNFTTHVGSASAAAASAAYSSGYGYQAVSSHVGSIALGANSTTSAASQCVIGGTTAGQGAITEVLIGNGASAATPNSPNIEPTQALGSDKAGGNFSVRGGRNTGAGNGGTLYFDIYPAGASSSTAGTATNMQRIVSTYYNERRAGSGTGFANIAGGLFAAYTDSTSSGTAAQNLHSFTLIGNTLLHDGDSLVFDTAMALTTLGGNLTLQCRLGSTDLTLFNAAAPAGATQANYRVTITRTGAATQRVKGELIIQATTNVTAAVYTTMAETLSGNLTLANRVTATVSGTITNQMSTVLYQPIPQT